MELLPTLRAQFEGLESYLDDPEIDEILIAGPEHVFLSRNGVSGPIDIELGDRRIRSLADRLLRALGGRANQYEVRTGRLSSELEVSVVGTPREERCPVIRVRRRGGASPALSSLEERGLVSAQISQAISAIVDAGRSLVIVGPFGAPRERLLSAAGQQLVGATRVLAIDEETGVLGSEHFVDLTLPAGTPMGGILAVGPDVVLVIDPVPTTWSGLLLAGRPVLAAMEAANSESGLERVIALTLAGDDTLSRAAAEALVLSMVGGLVELGAGPSMAIRRVMRPHRDNGSLELEVVAEQPFPAPEERVDSDARVEDNGLSSAGKASPLETVAFPSAELVEALSEEMNEALDAEDDVSESPPSSPELPEVSMDADEVDSASTDDPATDLEVRVKGARPSSQTPNVEPDGSGITRLPPRAPPAERQATLTGPPKPREVASQVRHVLDQLGGDSEVELPEVGEELNTSNVVLKPDLDPFETQDASLDPGLMDSTQAAEIGEMLAGGIGLASSSPLVPQAVTIAQPVGSDEAAENPADLEADLESKEDEGGFEEEKTPVAPLFEKGERKTRRPRRRPPSSSEVGPTEAAADELGDPTRRRKKKAPIRARAGRRRPRDPS